ncbi:MAG TPA: hypothetical protein PK971_05150, partial [Saprospiraceae bacterium]|nr:hypothetical protein [Saprospiraceae bacterium]
MKRIFPAIFLLLGLSAAQGQTLPPVSIPVHSRNYHDICRELDAYFQHDYRPTEAEEECWDNPLLKYARWKWFWRDRVLPDGSFPEPADTWLEGQKYFGSGAAQRGAPVWLNEGPTFNPNGGYWGMGRTKHVAIHPHNPSILYVGTPDGGIWKTTDGAKTWAPLGDGLPYMPVSVILMDHQHPDTIYISLGDKGGWWMRNLGIYKSTDGGLNWAPTGLSWKLSDNKVVYNVVMHPYNPQILFAAANFGILRSQDGGGSWETLRTGEFTDIEFRAGSDSVLYAAQHDYWGISQFIRSTDGGHTWQQLSNFSTTQNDIRINVGSTAHPDYVGLRFSNGKRFLLSKDGGLTFEDRSEMPEADHLAFSPTDTNIVYTSGVVVHRSTDQGKTWAPITHWYNDGVHAEVHADVHDIVPNPYNPEEIYFCNDGGLYRYHEPTETWQDLSNGLGIAQFYRIAMSEVGPMRLAAGSQDNGGWLRNSAGVWKHTNGGDAMCQAIDPTNANIIYTEYYGGNAIYRSMDNYFSAVEISNNLPNDPSGDWVTPFLLNPLNPSTFLVGMNEIFRSYDRGDHFETMTSNLTGSVDNKLRDLVMSSADTNIIAATWSNRVLRTTDGGKTWITKGLPGNEDAPRIEIDPRNPQRMWVCRSGFTSNQKVFRTVNGGQLWFNISAGLPNVPIHCILYDSLTNYLFVGTEIGVFHTDANVINWQPYGTGMPTVIVLDLKVRQKNRRLFAGTHGRGVYS